MVLMQALRLLWGRLSPSTLHNKSRGSRLARHVSIKARWSNFEATLRSALAGGVEHGERSRRLEGTAGAQHPVIGTDRADDLQPDGQALAGKPARHGAGRLLGEVERVREGRPIAPRSAPFA